jgi:hypothetical protein
MYQTSDVVDQHGCACYFIVNVYVVTHKWSYVKKRCVALSNDVYVFFYVGPRSLSTPNNASIDMMISDSLQMNSTEDEPQICTQQ